MSSTSPAAKTERLLNLVICLLYTRQPLSKARIRDAVPQYGDTASLEAFDRMFERDKDELRDLGIPLRTEPLDAYFDDEPGYRIDRREYALADIVFEADELAVLGLASRTWQQASLAGAASTAMRKLQAADVERDTSSVLGLEPRVRTKEPAFTPVKDAVLVCCAIAFDYRKADGQLAPRRLEPWAVTNWHGRWYVTGFDLDRDAPRVFRLGRVEGAVQRVGRPGAYQVPEDHDPLSMIAGVVVERAPQTATLRLRTGAGNTLRRRARAETRAENGGSTVSAISEGPGDWSQMDLEFTDAEIFAQEIAGFGPAVRVVHPPELIEAVVRRLAAARSAQRRVADHPAGEGTL
ncbi:MAG: WYL domain-containing protein [Actinomycetota bacterium]|nr:WYL domain-containing protein [Actinomycetota bacterium]